MLKQATQDIMYPKMVINTGGKEIDFLTYCLVFEKKQNGTFDAYVTTVRYKFKGELGEIEYKSKVIVDSVMNLGKPLKETLFAGKDDTLLESPFYKNMTKDEVKNHFSQCQILYRGDIEI